MGATVSNIGLYRVKTIDSLTPGTYTVTMLNDGNPVATKTLIVKDVCANETVKVKYLDKNGYYREYPFNNYWEGRDNPVKIGTTNKLITALLTDKTGNQNIGYKNNRIIGLVATEVTPSELELLSDLFTSPRVYVSFDQSNDTTWYEVDAKSRTGIYKTRKGTFTRVELEITMPENFSVKMI